MSTTEAESMKECGKSTNLEFEAAVSSAKDAAAAPPEVR